MGILAHAGVGVEGGGFGAVVEMAAGINDKLDAANASLATIATPRRNPIRTTVIGVTKADGTSPFLVAIQSPQVGPASGRMWSVRTAGVYGNDAHTPVTGLKPSVQATGTAAAPAAGAVIASISAANLLAAAPAGTLWQIEWTVTLEGTTAAGDRDNFEVTSPLGTLIAQSVNPIIPGEYVQDTFQAVQGTLGTAGFNVQAIGAATAGTQYSAQIVATPVSDGPGCIAEFYAGDLPDSAAAGTSMPIVPVLGDNFGPELSPPAQPVPMYFEPAREAIWVSHGETIYALVYGVQSGQQLVIVANVDDYREVDVQAMVQ